MSLYRSGIATMVSELIPWGPTLIPKATYLIGPRGPEYRRDDQTQAIRWYLYDGLGSVLAEVDPLGNLTATRKYDVYGAVRSSTGSSTSKHKFVGSLGHPSEPETGLIYMRARWMDPAIGRFLSEDPARDGSNWFEYCRGNPVCLADANGRVAFLAILGGAALGALVSVGMQHLLYGDINWTQVLVAAIAGGAGALVGGLYADRVLAALGEGGVLGIGQRLIRGVLGAATRGAVKGAGGGLFGQQDHRDLNGPLGRVLAAHAGNMFVLDILVNFLEDGIQGML